MSRITITIEVEHEEGDQAMHELISEVIEAVRQRTETREAAAQQARDHAAWQEMVVKVKPVRADTEAERARAESDWEDGALTRLDEDEDEHVFRDAAAHRAKNEVVGGTGGLTDWDDYVVGGKRDAEEEWEPPRCGHGHILLACTEDPCPEQEAYLIQKAESQKTWDGVRGLTDWDDYVAGEQEDQKGNKRHEPEQDRDTEAQWHIGGTGPLRTRWY